MYHFPNFITKGFSITNLSIHPIRSIRRKWSNITTVSVNKPLARTIVRVQIAIPIYHTRDAWAIYFLTHETSSPASRRRRRRDSLSRPEGGYYRGPFTPCTYITVCGALTWVITRRRKQPLPLADIHHPSVDSRHIHPPRRLGVAICAHWHCLSDTITAILWGISTSLFGPFFFGRNFQKFWINIIYCTI